MHHFQRPLPLFGEKTRNYIPEDVSRLGGGDGSPGTAEGVTRCGCARSPLSPALFGSRGQWMSPSMLLTNDDDSILGRPLKCNPQSVSSVAQKGWCSWWDTREIVHFKTRRGHLPCPLCWCEFGLHNRSLL